MTDSNENTRETHILKLRKLRLRLQRLKRDGSSSSRDFAQLADELAELNALQRELANSDEEAESAGAPGRWYGEEMGSETTGITARVRLRAAYVPTGSVHLMTSETMPLVEYKVTKKMAQPGAPSLGVDNIARLRFVTWVEGYSAQSIDIREIKPDAEPLTIRHLPSFFPEKTRALREVTNATVHARIDILGYGQNTATLVEEHCTLQVPLLPRTSLPLKVPDPLTGELTDLSHTLAAWVTPNADAVQQLLRAAVEHVDGNVMIGYQDPSPAAVRAQVEALFNAAKNADIRYINSVISFGGGPDEVHQRVRLPREAIANKSANCIDGTVLMASLLEAASLNPGIVVVPGHAFLAWDNSDGGGKWDFLETTQIGTHSFADAHSQGVASAKFWKLTGAMKLHDVSTLRAEGMLPME